MKDQRIGRRDDLKGEKNMRSSRVRTANFKIEVEIN